MVIVFPEKFADNDLDKYIQLIFDSFKKNPQEEFFFDLSNTGYVANQELLVFFGICKVFIASGIKFEISFFKKGTPNDKMTRRVKRQIIHFWEVWKIWKIVPSDQYEKYFGIDGNAVQRLQKELDYYPFLSDLYDWNGVTPFISLDYINNYNEREVEKIINPIYKLNDVINELLEANNCHHPFTSNSLSSIITEELYLNFLDHSQKSSFQGLDNVAFMSIALKTPLIEDEEMTFAKIQETQSRNFREEFPPQSRGFFYDHKKKLFKNDSYIIFSFADFGQGIPDSLRGASGMDESTNDSEILNYAFRHDSSRNPIWEEGVRNKTIPRGLFDAIVIVQRYKGLIIARSNKGKVIYDFSDTNRIEEARKQVTGSVSFFPGTLITIYIPTIEDVTKLNISTIKQDYDFRKVKAGNKHVISINQITETLSSEKKDLYTSLVKSLKSEMAPRDYPMLYIISFMGTEDVDPRIIKKCFYFLIADYDINNFNNVVIINPPDEKILAELSNEIHALNEAVKNYKIHPLPLITYQQKTDKVRIDWLGIYEQEDVTKLNNLMFPEYTIVKSDLLNPYNAIGQLSEFDKDGNLLTNMPQREELIEYSLRDSAAFEIKNLLSKHKCLIVDLGKSLFFCNGNYYQKEFIELSNLTNDRFSCNLATRLLYHRLTLNIDKFDDLKFVSLSSNGHKMIKSMEQQKLISKEDFILLDNYHNFEQNLTHELIDRTKKYILICDVVSTGNLATKLNKRLKDLGTEIAYIGVLVSTLITDFAETKNFLAEFDRKLLHLYGHPIPKFMREQIKKEILEKSVNRINSHTNIPITLSIKDTGFYESVIFNSKIYYEEKTGEIIIKNKFLEAIPSEAINVGFLKFNNVLHPYFFNTEKILPLIGESLIREIFQFISNHQLSSEKFKLFYPRKSGMETFDFQLLKKVLKNQGIEQIEIERFGTPEGWRFPHNANYLNTKINDSVCLILDDGSCSGDSIIQMIDEISFYDAREIVLLCIIGRVQDHKREFFSRIKNLKVKNSKVIPISIYFASHWHIPTYYLEDNPNTVEQNWLKNVIKIQNTPKQIKSIANVILGSIEPKPESSFTDYKYLPKIKATGQIPKKEILLIREELGKVVGYRLYRESFKFFNLFMRKYIRKKGKKDPFKEMELLCATFLYEPYLFDKLHNTMPDVAERIQDFVSVLLFKNPLVYEELTYKWEKKDIVHLFFIVYKNESLLKELSNEKFIALAKFTLPYESSLNYVLYKLLRYFPFEKEEESPYSSLILKRLIEVSDNTKLSYQIRSKLKIYRWFVSSLPSKGTFQESINKLKTNFERIVDLQYHDENIFNDKQIITSSAVDIGNKKRKGESYTQELTVIQNRWENITGFVNDILSFSKAFPNFFIDEKILDELEYRDNSLRNVYGEINELIYSEQFNELEVQRKLDYLFQSFVLEDSITLKIFSNPKTYNCVPYFITFRDLIANTYPNLIAQIKSDEVLNLDFPDHFMAIVFKELFHNFRYSDAEDQIRFYVSKMRNNNLKIKIWNKIRKDDMRKGGNTGQKTLSNLNNTELGSYYQKYERNSQYLQIIKFKLQ